MKTILSVKNLNKNFGHIRALNNLSFDIHKGNVYGILGPNGSGKSTTLGIILNVVNKTSGNFIWFDGNTNTQEALKKVGAIIERPNFYPYMTAVENLKLVCKIKEISFDKINVKLKAVNLYERRNSKFETYSLGMKQRLAIASALLNDPEILILDEPTNGLDPKGIQEVRAIIKKISTSETTILLASHLLDEVEKVCTHVIVIKNGLKLFSGKVDEISTEFGFIELKTNNKNKELLLVLGNFNGIESMEEENGIITLKLNKDISSEEIHAYLIKKGFVLSHLVKRLPTLEEQFLNLTNEK